MFKDLGIFLEDVDANVGVEHVGWLRNAERANGAKKGDWGGIVDGFFCARLGSVEVAHWASSESNGSASRVSSKIPAPRSARKSAEAGGVFMKFSQAFSLGVRVSVSP